LRGLAHEVAALPLVAVELHQAVELLLRGRELALVGRGEDVSTGRAGPRAGPPGFQGALLPALLATGDVALAATLRERLAAVEKDGLVGAPAAYYDQVLLLFALGHVEGRFRFSPDGALLPSWSAQ
jgi:endoglucanase